MYMYVRRRRLQYIYISCRCEYGNRTSSADLVYQTSETNVQQVSFQPGHVCCHVNVDTVLYISKPYVIGIFVYTALNREPGQSKSSEALKGGGGGLEASVTLFCWIQFGGFQ
jgi:hypothetical protein